MAITYTQTLSETTWNFSENNCVIEFSSDSVQTPVYCDIDITGLSTMRIYPLPDGSFWANLKEYLRTLLDSYEDNLDLSTINPLDIDTFHFDHTGIMWNDDIDITITFDDNSTDTDTLTPYILLGKEDLIAFKKGQTITGLSQYVMSPLKRGTSDRFHLRYWEGYPFDFTYCMELGETPGHTFPIDNLTNAVTSDNLTFNTQIRRIFISDGDTSISLEDYLPLVTGYNDLEIEGVKIDLWKYDSDCGVYIKWLNQYGGFNYWLFNEEHLEELTHRSEGYVNNDFSNLEDTISPKKSLGRTVENEMTVRGEHLTVYDIDVLRGLVESPKIYLFTGERFTRNSFNNWVEIEMKNSTLPLRDFKGNVPDVEFSFNLPTPVTIAL